MVDRTALLVLLHSLGQVYQFLEDANAILHFS